MSRTLLVSTIIAALGGFLFGFDTVVISGAEQKIQSLWGLSEVMHGNAMSSALWGTVLGSLIGAWPTDRYGRKATLLWIGLLYFVSAVWSGFASDVYSFIIARFIGGLGVGISTVAAPLYITEIAPPQWRGRLTGAFQFNIVFGILIAFVSNSLIRGTSEHDWRWMMGVEAFPALAYTLLCIGIPESPRWLINVRGERSRATQILQQVNPSIPPAEIDALVTDIAQHGNDNPAGRSGKGSFWSSDLRWPISIAFLVAFFNQLSGINAILYFAPRILGMAGLTAEASFVQSVGIGIVNLIFTMLGLWLIDRLGRRTLLLIGSIGYIFSLGAIAYTFATNEVPFRVAGQAMAVDEAYDKLDLVSLDDAANRRLKLQADANKAVTELNTSLQNDYAAGNLSVDASSSSAVVREQARSIFERVVADAGQGGTYVLWGIFAFIAAHAIGQGAVIWVLISEVFPNEFRAAGQSLGSFAHWIFAALLTLLFPIVVTKFPPAYVFGFFCGMMVLQLIWVLTLVPETKGVPLEELQDRLLRKRAM